MKRKYFEFNKEWFVFPPAIELMKDSFVYIPVNGKKAYIFRIHFLWWHWQWVFAKEAA